MDRARLDRAITQTDLYNHNGRTLCHAVRCRKSARLREAHGGLFCPAHLRALDGIRAWLEHAKRTGDLSLENDSRQAEIEFRKRCDAGHMWWKLYRVEMPLERR